MIVDANLLVYAVDRSSPHHERSAEWITDVFNGTVRIGLPWPSLLAFLRFVTHPRVMERTLTPAVAWQIVEEWLAIDVVWCPAPGPRHAQVVGSLVTTLGLTGNLIPDAHLAALALEHGVAVASADTDFARFPGIDWLNPLRG